MRNSREYIYFKIIMNKIYKKGRYFKYLKIKYYFNNKNASCKNTERLIKK